MSRPITNCMALALFALVVSLASCGKAEKATEKATTDQAAPRTFKSPAEAGSALFDAAKAGDQQKLLAIFGSDGRDVLFSGDPVQDKNNREGFINAYSRMNRWSVKKDGEATLYIGADNFPFPVPLKKNDAGQWSFDTAAGKDEVLARRVGNNELIAINVLGDIAGAQQEYFNQTHQFAQKFVSDEGQHNGLFWPVAEGQHPSPLGPLAEVAKALGYSRGDKPQPFSGYYYRVLTQQGNTAKGGARDYMANGKLTGGFAVLAYPAKYGDSGIMTFLIGKDGVVYEKNLGEKTAEAAVAITEYNPGDGWTVVLAPDRNAPVGTKSAKK